MVIVAIIAGGLAVAFLGNSNKTVEKVDVTAKPIEVGSDKVNEITVKDKDAALTVFGKQFEVVDQKINIVSRESSERVEALRKELKDGNNTLKAQVAALTDELTDMRSKGVEDAYQNANKRDSKTIQKPPALPDKMPDLGLNGGLNFDDLNFNMSTPKPQEQAQQKANDYGPNYFILKPTSTSTTVSRKSGGDSLNASEDDLFSSMSAPAAQNTNFNDKSAGQGQVDSKQKAQQLEQVQKPQKKYESAAEAYADQQKSSQNGNGPTDTGLKLQRITIPAFSFVEVTTLHGVRCPIGANSPGVKTEIPARPVVLPVRGIFRGPNGASVDVGTINLMGLCSGRRTSSSNSGRATIRVEQMSYWDEGGDAQMSASTGYIVDTRDNEQDVYGRLDQASGRTLALESAAAAGAAFATALSQSQYTNQSNLGTNGSTSIQQLTGSATQAATNQGVAAIFTEISNRFKQEANAAIDTVVVEPGIRLRFVTDQPIHVFKPAEAFDIDAGKNDVLL
nr:conjugal transfer protein TraB [Pseudomonas sp. MWU12-2323]